MVGQRPKRALVIEDDAIVRGVIYDLVASLGYAVDIAASGPEGMTLFDRRRYDVVLTDLQMPGMTGWEVLGAVRALDAKMPVVIVTGAPVAADDPRLTRSGAVLVKKPMDPRLLEDALRRVTCSSGFPSRPSGI